ncbi:hypothetical protein EVJ58_g5090 [Rhodofomes roseus]|uniref:Uncharacterized protein n=1 Tax=Rhodofomes roseus TaxID=34475 RepID=A0A4Y9YEB7_9APHY|nr:hypothetical protein EVJ58_g5090 [Rhodofomes roseus]
MGEKTPSLPSAVPTPVHASWDFQMQTSWGSAHSKSTDSGRTGTGAQRNPLYTNPNLWLASPTSPNTRLAEAGAARRTPPAAYVASIRSQFASRSQSHSRSHTQSSKYAPASTPRSPLSPAATISTVDIEHALDMSERFASGSGDSRDPTPPLPLRQYMYAPRDSIRTSAYYAGQFPDPINGAGAARNVHSRTGSATNSSKASSVRGRVTPPNLRLVDRRKPSSPSASLYSLHEDQLESAGANRLLMSSPTVHVSADGEVIPRAPTSERPALADALALPLAPVNVMP